MRFKQPTVFCRIHFLDTEDQKIYFPLILLYLDYSK